MAPSKVAWRGGAGIALLVVAVGVLLILQGWRSRIPGFGVLTNIDAAQELIDHHRLPDKGAISSFASFTPPGSTWLMVPGLLAARDPRLFESIGSLSLYVGACFGVFLVARRSFGRSTAVVAVVLFAFSEFGLTVGTTLFQRYPLQFFIVWIVYFVMRWVEDDDGRWLAAATLTWAAGMNVHMELAPAILIVPVVWLLWRPSVRLVALALAALSAALLWYPYVEFQRDRRFVDVRSQILRESIRPVDFAASWCDPADVPASWLVDAARDRASEAARSTWSARRWLSDRADVAARLWSTNFTRSIVPGSRYPLFLLTVLGIGAALVSDDGLGGEDRQEARFRQRLKWLALGLTMVAIASNEYVLSRWIAPDGRLEPSSIWTIRAMQAALLLIAWLCAAFGKHLGPIWRRLTRLLSAPTTQPRVFAASLVVIWLSLLLVSTAERRLWQLWPLQVIALSGASVFAPGRLGFARSARWLAAAAVCIVVSANVVLAGRFDSWRREGWAGRDAPQVAVVDAIAHRMRSKRATEGSIGYQVDFWRFMADANRIDARYKVGADLDLLLKYRHHISNRDRCAEGFRPDDDYRVVQVASAPAVDSHGRNRLKPSAATQDAFATLSRTDMYDVLERR